MATVQKMMVCGLRSFGPNEEDIQHIRFGSPLTLILGENGCGKTTIIEALKFGSSGEVPGGSRSGQGFVNDPKLNGTVSTKGQVRLKFVDAKGNKFIVIKSVQLTHKGATSQFKRLETMLQKINPDGTTTDISSRCADVDATICDMLGVSKPILNYVIFCHQEDSAWPLEEPKKLKERFDEIFGATEYNKCAEVIRKLIKERIVNNKILASKVQMSKQTADIVEKKRVDLRVKEEKYANYEENIKDKEAKLVPINKRLQEICELETNLSRLHENCAQTETMIKSLKEQQRDILKNIFDEYEGSDQQLKEEISLFESNREKCDQQKRTLESDQLKIESSKESINKKIDKLQIKMGKLQAEKKLHEGTVVERNTLFVDVKRSLPDVALSWDLEEDVVNAIRTVDGSISGFKNELTALEHNCEREEEKQQEEINSVRSKLTKTTHEVDSKRKQIGELKGKSREIDSQLHELDYSDEKLKSLDLKISRNNVDLKAMQTSFDADAAAKSINDDKIKIRNNEEELETLEREFKILQQNSIKEAELETLNHDIIKRNAEIHKLTNKHFESFTKIFGDDMPNSGFYKKNVDVNKEMKNKMINDLNKKITSKQRESTTLETKCRFQKDKLENLERELESDRKRVLETCNGKPFEKVYDDLHNSIEKVQNNKGLYSSAKIMYEKFIRDFQKQEPCCPVCKTDFANKKSATNVIVTELQKHIQAIPDNLKKVEEELKSKQLEYNNLLQIKPVSDKIHELSTVTIPKLKSEYEDMTNFHKRVTGELENLAEELKKPQVVVEACNQVTGDSALIDQYHQEVIRSKKKIAELESQIEKVPSNRSRQETEISIENLKVDLSSLRRTHELSQKKLQQYKDRCQELGASKNKYVEEQLQLQKAMQGKAQLYDQLKELKEKEESLKSEIEELQIQIKPLTEEVEKTVQAKESLKLKNRSKIREFRSKLESNQKLFQDIKRLQSKIQHYISSNGDGAYTNTLTEITTLREEQTDLDAQINEIAKKIADVTKRIISQESSFRNLKDNLTLRDKRKQEAELQSKVQSLKIEIGEHNYRTILAEKKKLNQQEDDIRREINTCAGRNAELKMDMDKMNLELNTPDNKQAHKMHKKVFIELTCSKKVVSDLEIFVKVLEKGILDFHKDRMMQINKIIRQLWRSIYRGNDCDYIEIKTDDTKTTGTRRSYNYKVVQVKSNAELDMRGRCSAGQKVLACLVIRMALAETFSKSCGILALDEPTTNLDRANINSLSDALVRLVSSRQNEKNFQLIVITHDEEFIMTLTRVDISYFWRISRNGKGNSVVEREFNV